MINNIRRIAAEALVEWEGGHIYAESLVERNARSFKLSKENRNLLNALIIGVVRNRRLLDYWISTLRPEDIDLQVRCHLRVGLLQLFIMKLPDHAAVNETVNSARKGIRGLINAILRRSIRERNEILESSRDLPPAVRYSHPDWLFQRWVSQFGEENTIKLLKWNQEPSLTTFRLNPLITRSADVVASNAAIREHPDHPGFYISNGLPPKDWMNDGFIYIQDPSTVHAVHILDPRPGENVLDACAAPGGKATQIAAAMQNKGSLMCTDSNHKRLPRLKKNLSKLGITIATIENFDWIQPSPNKWKNHFDAILVDVPCSNSGVFRKRVDARWRLHPSDIIDVIASQKAILSNAISCLKPGGRLVYSTCSIDPEENSHLIKEFITNNPNLILKNEQIIHPFIDKTDGAYAALLIQSP